MKKNTMQSLADALGVSRITVWKALNHKEGVSETLRQKIIEKAAECGYRMPHTQPAPPVSTPPLKVQRSVSVVVSRPESSTFWMQIIHQIAKELSRLGINMMYTYLPSHWYEGFQLPASLTAGGVSGMIVLNIYDPAMLRALAALSLPKVFLDTVPLLGADQLNGDLVMLEGRCLVRQITNRLIESGRTRLGFIGDVHYAQTNTDRYQGFLDALREHNITLDETVCHTSPLPLHLHTEEIESFLRGLTYFPDAFVCASDFIASYVASFFDQPAYADQKRVVLTGFDNSSEYPSTAGKITSVDVQTSTLGKRLAQKIAFRLRYPDASFECSYITSKIIYRSPLTSPDEDNALL